MGIAFVVNGANFAGAIPVQQEETSLFVNALAAEGYTVPDTQQARLNQLIVALKELEIFDNLVLAAPFMGSTLAQKSLLLVGGSGLSLPGTVIAIAEQGITIDDSTEAVSTGVATPSLVTHSFAVAVSTAAPVYNFYMSASAAAVSELASNASGKFQWISGNAAEPIVSIENATTGVLIGSRRSTSDKAMYHQGVQIASDTNTVTVGGAGTYHIGGRPGLTSLTEGTWSSDLMLAFDIGLSVAEVQALTTIMQDFSLLV